MIDLHEGRIRDGQEAGPLSNLKKYAEQSHSQYLQTFINYIGTAVCFLCTQTEDYLYEPCKLLNKILYYMQSAQNVVHYAWLRSP